MIADTGYDSNALRHSIRRRGLKAAICAHPCRKRKPRLNRRIYGKRYVVEVAFFRLKRFRALATRFEKTSRNYLALVQLACAMLWLQDLLNGA